MTNAGMVKGAGIWLRRTTDLRPDLAARHLDFVVVPAQTERGPVNRGPAWREWIAEFVVLGGAVLVMDWLPSPDRDPKWLEPLAEWAVRVGARVLMTDTEHDAGWRLAALEKVRRYAATLHRVARAYALRVAVTDYGSGGIGTSRLRMLLGEHGIAVPQSYDPNDPDGSDPRVSHAKSLAYWMKAGATADRTIKGLGIWLRSERRHRSEDELLGHTAGVPEGVPAICGWYGTTHDAPEVLARSLPILSAWVASRASLAPTEPPPAERVIRVEGAGFNRDEILDLAVRAKACGDIDAAVALEAIRRSLRALKG